MEHVAPKNTHFVIFMNLLGLSAIAIALLVAFYYQLTKFELPCPLCLLQRAGLILAGCGFLFNICLDIKNAHYGMIIIGCLVTGAVAARQTLLHIMPNDTGYGSPFLGFHFYTWALIAAILLVMTVVLMMISGELSHKWAAFPRLPKANRLISLLFVFLITCNVVSTILECGSGQCKDNPIKYDLLSK